MRSRRNLISHIYKQAGRLIQDVTQIIYLLKINVSTSAHMCL